MADDAADVIESARTLLGPALRLALARLDVHNRRVADYHLGFADEHGAPTLAGSGKQIRGALALLSAKAVLGDADAAAEAALPAAVGVELVHHYSLLHDDIIDHDTERRHRPAAWTVFGQAATILAGDALAALAVECAFGIPDAGDTNAGRREVSPTAGAVAQALAVANRRMAAGQAADIAFERAAEVRLDECLAMVADKTGALLSCAASVGAIAAGGPPEAIDGLAAFGRHVGLAFQLVDDLIGLWGTADEIGKPVGSDIESRKMSLPVVAALQAGAADADGSAGWHAQRLAAIYAHEGTLSAVQVAAALAAIDGAGGRSWAENEAAAQTDAALAILHDLPIHDSARRDLIAVTDMLCRRTG